jgi:hypothetical protein
LEEETREIEREKENEERERVSTEAKCSEGIRKARGTRR